MVGGGVLLVVVYSSLALWVHMLGTQRASLVVLRLGWHHTLALLHENTFNIITRHWAGAWITLRLLPLYHQLGTFVVVVIAWTVKMHWLLVLLAWIIAINIGALPDTQRLLVHLLAWCRSWDKRISHLREGLSRGSLSKVRRAVDRLPIHTLAIWLQMVLVLPRGQVRFLLRLESHYFWIFRRLHVFNLIDHVCKPIRLCLTVLMLYFWLLLVKFLFRRLSTAFTIVLLRLEIVLDAERVHLFIVLIGVEPFTVKKHLVTVAWRVRALHNVWVIYLHLLETTLDCCVVHNNAGRIIQTELLLQLTGSFRALWSLATGVMTAAILMWYATWSLIWQHSQSIIVDLASVEFLSYVLDSLIIIDAWALTWLTFLQLWLVDKLLDEGWVQ